MPSDALLLGDKTPPAWLGEYPKLSRLDDLRRQGVLVPPGALAKGALGFAEVPRGIPGPWILRSVMPREDSTAVQSTGLSLSIPNLGDLEAVQQAQAQCRKHAQTLAEQGLWPMGTDMQLAWLLQAQIDARYLAIAILDAQGGDWYLEVYPPGQDPFSGKQEPLHRGALEALAAPDLKLDALGPLLERVQSRLPHPHGIEVEVVLDPAGTWHCVQAKPNTQPLFAQYQSFMEAARHQLHAQGDSFAQFPHLELDAEHNPEPLSAAHTWLVQALESKDARSYLVLCGWLFAIKRRNASPPSTENTVDIQSTIERLYEELLPQAQEALCVWERRWTTIDRTSIETALHEALALCRSLIAQRARWLDPVRRSRPKDRPRADFSVATTLTQRDAYSEALPTRWDLSAPSLAQAKLPTGPSHPLPDCLDNETAWDLLEEGDDHLFALALVPLRKIWLLVAEQLGIDSTLLFCVSGQVLREFGQGAIDKADLLGLARQGLREQEKQALMHPPLSIEHGSPAPPLSTLRWRGLPFGPSLHGVLHKRRDLEALLANPPSDPHTILAIPALTAPAALALHRLGIRAVLCEYGGVASHGARMAAELGLSALVGCRGCMEIPDGQRVHVDTERGRLWWRDQA